jgi:hypothetical protein
LLLLLETCKPFAFRRAACALIARLVSLPQYLKTQRLSNEDRSTSDLTKFLQFLDRLKTETE